MVQILVRRCFLENNQFYVARSHDSLVLYDRGALEYDVLN